MNIFQITKLVAASILIHGIERLQQGGPLPLSQAEIRNRESINTILDEKRIGAALTRVFLYAVVVELAVKHLWEQEHGKTAPHTHNVHKLFDQLSEKTRHEVEALYNNCCDPYKAAVQAGQQQHGSDTVAVTMASLKEALHWNQGAVMDLKYDMTPRGQSVPCGSFWSPELAWVFPNGFPNFAIELTSWAKRQQECPVRC